VKPLVNLILAPFFGAFGVSIRPDLPAKGLNLAVVPEKGHNFQHLPPTSFVKYLNFQDSFGSLAKIY
jgi:hypothetical protein